MAVLVGALLVEAYSGSARARRASTRIVAAIQAVDEDKQKNSFIFLSFHPKMVKQVVLVTGGRGLLGSAIRHVIETELVGTAYGKLNSAEEWIFLSSSDGDLRSAYHSSTVLS